MKLLMDLKKFISNNNYEFSGMPHLTLFGKLYSIILQFCKPQKEKHTIIPVFVYKNVLLNTHKIYKYIF